MENDNDVPITPINKECYDMAMKICILQKHKCQNTSFTKQKDPIQMIIYLYFL